MSAERTKTVCVNGNQYSVPLWVHYVAIDNSGDCWGYRERPMAGVQSWFVSSMTNDSMHLIDKVTPARHWSRTLIAA